MSSPRTMRFFFAMQDDVRPETLFRISSQMLDEEEVEEDDVAIRKRERERRRGGVGKERLEDQDEDGAFPKLGTRRFFLLFLFVGDQKRGECSWDGMGGCMCVDVD